MVITDTQPGDQDSSLIYCGHPRHCLLPTLGRKTENMRYRSVDKIEVIET